MFFSVHVSIKLSFLYCVFVHWLDSMSLITGDYRFLFGKKYFWNTAVDQTRHHDQIVYTLQLILPYKCYSESQKYSTNKMVAIKNIFIREVFSNSFVWCRKKKQKKKFFENSFKVINYTQMYYLLR